MPQLIRTGERQTHEVLLRHLDRLVEQGVGIDRRRRGKLLLEERRSADLFDVFDVALNRVL